MVVVSAVLVAVMVLAGSLAGCSPQQEGKSKGPTSGSGSVQPERPVAATEDPAKSDRTTGITEVPRGEAAAWLAIEGFDRFKEMKTQNQRVPRSDSLTKLGEAAECYLLEISRILASSGQAMPDEERRREVALECFGVSRVDDVALAMAKDDSQADYGTIDEMRRALIENIVCREKMEAALKLLADWPSPRDTLLKGLVEGLHSASGSPDALPPPP
jgi:hypothetical protein